MDKKINILMLTEDFLPIYGGISSVVEQSANALSQYADVTIGTVEAQTKKNEKYIEKPSPYRVVRGKGHLNPITTNMYSLWRVDKQFRDAIESQKYDIIHCHFPLSLFKYGIALGKKYNIPVVITAHSLYKVDVKNAVKNEFLSNVIVRIIVKRLNKAFKIWAVSNFCKNFLLNYGLRKDTIVVNNSVDMVNNCEEIQNCDFANLYNISTDTFTIINVGRIVAMKNGILLIEALNKLKHYNLDIKLVFIGSGPEQSHLERVVKKYKLEKNVLFVGKLDKTKLKYFYMRCDLIGFTSVGDSSGLIHIEGAYYNKPTLAVKDTAISERMVHLENGILVENDIEDCAKKILYCYNNREQLKEIGENARKSIYRSYLDENIAKELFACYTKTISDYNAIYKK